MNAGNWYLPHPKVASWTNEFLFEVSAFPRSKNDDWLDAWTQAREALSGDDISDYSMYTAENVLRLEEFYRRMGYDLTPPGL